MSKFIKVFNDVSEYNLFKNSENFLYPNVSYARKGNEVFYNAQEIPSILKASYNATSDNMICLQNSSNVKTLTIDGEEIEFEPVRFEIETINIKGGDIIQDENGIITNPFDGAISYTPESWSFKPADDNIKVTDIEHILMIQEVEGMQVGGVVSKNEFGGMIVVDSNTNSFIVSDVLLSEIKNILTECDAIGFACCSLNEETGNYSVIDTISNVGKQVAIETTIEINSSEIILNEDGKTAVFPNNYCVNFAPLSWQIKPQDNNIKVSDLSYFLLLIQHNGQQSAGVMPFAELVGDGAYFNLNEENNSVDASTFLELYPSAVLYQGQAYGWAFCKVDESTSAITEIINTVQFLEKPMGLPSPYVFNTTGEHEVEIELVDETFVNSLMFAETTLKNIVIPDSVTSIGDEAFRSCSSLTSIDIPDSVTSIGDYVFDGCSNLTSVTIGSGVTSIGYSAFSGCSSLTSVTIGSGVTSIGMYAFRGCSSLTSIDIPDSVTSIGDSTFNGCSSLSSVAIGSGVTSIGEKAFENCSSLTSINIPDSVTSIGDSTFNGCSSLSSVAIGSGVTSIGERVFYNCSRLTSVTIGSSVTSIGYGAFYGCKGLTGELVIPDSVTSIEYHAFYNCSGLTSVTIGSGVTYIGGSAFNGCSSLSSITCYATTAPTISNDTFSDIKSNGVLYYPSGSDYSSWMQTSSDYLGYYYWTSQEIGVELPELTLDGYDIAVLMQPLTTTANTMIFGSSSSLSSVTEMSVDGSVLATPSTGYTFSTAYDWHIVRYKFNNHVIPSSSFTSCKRIKEISISDSVTSIGDSVFSYCSSLTGELVIPDSVTSIGRYAFQGCGGLTSTIIPDGVTSIGDEAFAHCSSLTGELVIPDSVTFIGDKVFSYCSSLDSIKVSSGNTVYDSRENCNCIIETATNKLIQGCNNSFIPNSVTTIGDWAFYNCNGLTSVTIGSGVTSIGDEAFRSCSSLTSIDIPDSVTSIENGAFRFCSRLTSVTIGSGVTSIGDYAFTNSSSLSSITCYATTAPTIGKNTFQYVKSNGVLYYPSGSDYSSWMNTNQYYLGYYNWTGQEITE